MREIDSRAIALLLDLQQVSHCIVSTISYCNAEAAVLRGGGQSDYDLRLRTDRCLCKPFRERHPRALLR